MSIKILHLVHDQDLNVLVDVFTTEHDEMFLVNDTYSFIVTNRYKDTTYEGCGVLEPADLDINSSLIVQRPVYDGSPMIVETWFTDNTSGTYLRMTSIFTG